MRLDPHMYGVNEEKEEDFFVVVLLRKKKKNIFFTHYTVVISLLDFKILFFLSKSRINAFQSIQSILLFLYSIVNLYTILN